MILNRVTLHNFGTYRGRQTMDLRPPSAKRPIILVGGLNGRGKTTLLDALQLALYGKRARCSNRGALKYEEYLRRSISRQVPAEDGAAVEVEFEHIEEGQRRTFVIHRSWAGTTTGVRERVQVLRDGHLDRLLTEHWDDHVDSFIPVGISGLFFFDGEKIEELATGNNAQAILENSIASLLGLDLVSRLSADLLVLERRKAASAMEPNERRQLNEIESTLARLQSRLDESLDERASYRSSIDGLYADHAANTKRFRDEGGEFYMNRAALEREREIAERDLAATEHSLRELAAGALPLALVQDLLEAVATQDVKERDAGLDNALHDLLATRDAAVVADLQAKHKGAAATLAILLERDRAQRVRPHQEAYLKLSDGERTLLSELRAATIPAAVESAHLLLLEWNTAGEALTHATRSLASVPDEKIIADIHAELDRLAARIKEQEHELARCDGVVASVERELKVMTAKRDALTRAARDRGLDQEDDARLVIHSERVRTTLEHFRAAVLRDHVSRISALVLDSFRRIARKTSLISRLSIDPSTFELHLVAGDGAVLPPERLSAGERQILAVSLLWGLARASGRPIPTIIDTPLGRLDIQHREHMLKHYFPAASHQVLLLATDAEVDVDAFVLLEPSIGREYVLDFDDATGSTTIRVGNFWEN